MALSKFCPYTQVNQEITTYGDSLRLSLIHGLHATAWYTDKNRRRHFAGKLYKKQFGQQGIQCPMESTCIVAIVISRKTKFQLNTPNKLDRSYYEWRTMKATHKMALVCFKRNGCDLFAVCSRNRIMQ